MLLADAFGGTDGGGGTNEQAEVAAYAAFAVDAGDAFGGVEADGLVAAVEAGDVATATAYAQLAVYHGEDLRGAVEVGRRNEVG